MSNSGVLVIHAHSRDCNGITFCVEDSDYEISELTDGYVPRDLSIGGGDAINLTIDVETGTVVGWDAEKVKAKLAEYIREFNNQDEMDGDA